MAEGYIQKPLKIYTHQVIIATTTSIAPDGYAAIDTGLPVQSGLILPVFTFMPYGLVLANFYTKNGNYWIDVNNYHVGYTVTLTAGSNGPLMRYIVQ